LRADLTATSGLFLIFITQFAACAHGSPGVPVPDSSNLLELPPETDLAVDPVALTHLMRGLYFLNNDNAGAAIPHLRLALMYAPRSAFIHERLGRAWAAVGRRDRADEALRAGLEKSPEDPWLHWLAGELALQARDFEQAALHLRVASGPREAADRAGPALVEVLLWLHRNPDALLEATRLQALRPDDAEMALKLAGSFEDHGELDFALETYRHVRRQRPADRAGALGEMRVLTLLGRVAEAGDSLIPLFAYYPDEIGLYVQIARLYFRAGRADADAYRTEAMRQVGDDAAGRMAIAAGDLLEGRVKEGLAVLRETVVAAPAALDARLYLAEVLLATGDSKGCLAALDVKSPPKEYRTYRPRAWCFAGSSRLDMAMEQVVWAVLLAPRALDPLLDGVRIIAQHHDAETARVVLEDLEKRTAERLSELDRLWARVMLADLFGRGEEALALIRQLPEEVRHEPEIVMKVTDLQARYGELAVATAALEELVRESPDDPIRLNAFGFTLADAGVRLDEAAVWLRRAHRLAPDEGFIIDSLGWLFFRQGQLAPALELLQVASRASPGDPEILRHLGDVYAAIGKKEAARAAYRAALDGPVSPLLRRLLDGRLQELSGS
jgi:predicted Zn-dependent protease